MQKAYLTRQELAKLLGYAPTTLAKLKDNFPVFIYSKGSKGKALYPIESIKEWAQKKGKTEILKALEDN